MEIKAEDIGLVLLVIWLVVSSVFTIVGFVVLGTGRQFFLLSTPIESLEPGQVYEVRSVVREGKYCFLNLRAENEPKDAIKFYRLPSEDVPLDLLPGDGLVRHIPEGLERLANRFS